jgi:IS4 transposase
MKADKNFLKKIVSKEIDVDEYYEKERKYVKSKKKVQKIKNKNKWDE